MSAAQAQQFQQRAYYAATAETYDEAHSYENEIAFSVFAGIFDYLNINSVLDIGSGTGRALLVAKQHRPNIKAIGIEPSEDLRARGHAKGIPSTDLIDGDAQKLPYADGSFDLVCEFAALHHIPRPDLAVSEMLRVARKAVFISDSNNFGQGGLLSRTVKQAANAFGLWPLAALIKTRGKGYYYSDTDGVFYSYSAFNNLPLVQAACKQVHVMGDLKAGGGSVYRSSPDAIILGIK